VYETRHIPHPSDGHGHECGWCQERPCEVNVYIVAETGEGDVEPACPECVDKVVEYRHHGDDWDVLIEHSTAPLPATVAVAC
jgi:hypothetical protein